jgi:hypothetical protein
VKVGGGDGFTRERSESLRELFVLIHSQNEDNFSVLVIYNK